MELAEEIDMDLVTDRVLGSTDVDVVTDKQLERESQDRKSKSGTIRLRRIYSMIVGNKGPSRSQVLYSTDSTSDLRLWTIQLADKSINCGCVHNPALLREPSISKKKSKKATAPNYELLKVWAQLARVERLEIEDSEGTMTELPRHLTTKLRNLTSLSLTWTHVKTIPPEFFLLPLKSLNLQRNQLKHLAGVENCTTLSALDVSSNQLETLPKSLGTLKNLVTLNVSANQLRELPESLGDLHALRTFDCAYNKLCTLPETICNMLELSSLDVCGNQLVSLPESLGGLLSLVDLRARSNALSCLPESFIHLTGVQSLLLRKNLFEEVPPQLARLPNLHSLNLRDNKIRSVEVPLLALHSLNLDHNELTSIDKAVTACAALKSLSLQYNRIRNIPPEISRLKELRSLHLSGTEVCHVPPSLGQLSFLKHLSMNATQMRDVPQVVLEMTQLTQLDLDDCEDLDQSTRLAYKRNGIAGIRRYRTTENPTPAVEIPTPVVEIRPNQGNRVINAEKKKTLYPAECSAKTVTFEMESLAKMNEQMRGTTPRYSIVETIKDEDSDDIFANADQLRDDSAPIIVASGNQMVGFGGRAKQLFTAKPKVFSKPFNYLLSNKPYDNEHRSNESERVGEEVRQESGSMKEGRARNEEGQKNEDQIDSRVQTKHKHPPPPIKAKPVRVAY